MPEDYEARLAACRDDEILYAIGFGTLALMVDGLNPADPIALRAKAFVTAVDRRLAELAQVRGPAGTS